MMQFRTFYKKSFLIFFVCTGLLTGALRIGFYTKSNNSFTHWFASLVEENENIDIKEKVASLKYSHENLNNIIYKATELVKDNYEAFSLPIPDDFKQRSNKLFYLLISQWNSSENNSTLILFPFQKWLKSIIYSPLKTVTSDLHDTFSTHRYVNAYHILGVAVENTSIRIIPLVDSIAIGAP